MITNEVIRRRPRDQSELPEWYAQLFEAQRVDELTTQEVASLLNVTPSNLYYWRRRLRSAETSAAVPPDSQDEASARGLVRVHLTRSSPRPNDVSP